MGIFLIIFLIMIGTGSNRSYQDVRTLPLQLSDSLIRFYKQNISPCGSPECVFHPTCSIYSKEALVTHGFFKGWAMSFDRMTRCNDENWIYPEILVEDQIKKYDPVPLKSL